MRNNYSILSTRPLPEDLINEAREEGITIDPISFIETEPVQSISVLQEIENTYLQTLTVIFTSMNAVEAVAEWQEGQDPDWKIYCIGNATRKLVEKYFGEKNISGTADSAAELAALILADDEVEDVVFFCGNQRREELPSILRKNNIEVHEIIVYQTITVPRKIEKHYAGILFFSPSAVESFFKLNKPNVDTILFAIGNTTANELRKYSQNRILVAESPGKENLVRQAMQYFLNYRKSN